LPQPVHAAEFRVHCGKNVSSGSSGKIADAPLKTNEIYLFGKMEEKMAVSNRQLISHNRAF
jgi:hypothetical protein